MGSIELEHKPDWEQLEHLIVEIQKQLSPDAKVSHNVKLEGVDSETLRQIDVLIEQNIGQYNMRIVIDCKDYSKPVDVKGVEEFAGLVQDVRAHKGALVCPSGFTKSAKKRAKKLQIDLYSPVDTSSHKWQAHVAVPVLCDFRNMFMAFGISTNTYLPLFLSEKFYEQMVFDVNGTELGSAHEVAGQKWNEGMLPDEPGEHLDISIFGDSKVFIDNGHEQLAEVRLTVRLLVKQQVYLGHLPLEKVSGLKDEQTGGLVTNAFTTGILDPVFVQNNWKKVEDMENLEFTPLFLVKGYNCYGSST